MNEWDEYGVVKVNASEEYKPVENCASNEVVSDGGGSRGVYRAVLLIRGSLLRKRERDEGALDTLPVEKYNSRYDVASIDQSGYKIRVPSFVHCHLCV